MKMYQTSLAILLIFTVIACDKITEKVASSVKNQMKDNPVKVQQITFGDMNPESGMNDPLIGETSFSPYFKRHSTSPYQKYKLVFQKDSNKTIRISEIKTAGLESSNVWFNNQELDDFQLIDLSTDKEIILDFSEEYFISSLEIFASNEGNADYPAKFKLYGFGNDWELVYETKYLVLPRASFWNNEAWTKFNTTKKHCISPQTQTFDGKCKIPRVLCQDYDRYFELTKEKSCSIKIDGHEMYCFPVKKQDKCNDEKTNICLKYAHYLEHPNQLLQLHYEENIIHSVTCEL